MAAAPRVQLSGIAFRGIFYWNCSCKCFSWPQKHRTKLCTRERWLQ